MGSTFLEGHCVEMMEGLPEKWFHTILTSPPYWMLRLYGCCAVTFPRMSYRPLPDCDFEIEVPEWAGELGQEPTPAMFIGHLVYIFEAAKRILRDDGTLWVNLGDTYSKSGGKGTQGLSSCMTGRKHYTAKARELKGPAKPPTGWRPKDRLGLPWRFAMAMQAAGWIWRDEVLWHKSTPSPEAAKDRTTKAHEPILLFAKRRKYDFHIECIREESTGNAHPRGSGRGPKSSGRSKGQKNNSSFSAAVKGLKAKRNPRSVWKMAAEPTKDKHFAAYPTKLVRKIIAVSTSDHGCCRNCGKQYQPIIESQRIATRPGQRSKIYKTANWQHGKGAHNTAEFSAKRERLAPEVIGNRDPERHVLYTKITGWKAGCRCEADVVPCRVLDPFGGRGTTAMVCDEMHRECTSIELKAEYVDIAINNVIQLGRKQAGMFATDITITRGEGVTVK